MCVHPDFGGIQTLSQRKGNKALPGKCQLGCSHASDSGAMGRAGRERESSAPLEPSGHDSAQTRSPKTNPGVRSGREVVPRREGSCIAAEKGTV